MSLLLLFRGEKSLHPILLFSCISGGYDYGGGYGGIPMATYVDGLFIPQPYVAQYYYENAVGLQQPQPPSGSSEDDILKEMIKKQM